MKVEEKLKHRKDREETKRQVKTRECEGGKK